MKFGKLFSVAAAFVIAGSCMVMPASADKKKIAFSADNSLLTASDSVPTISFDTSKWDGYVHLTKDAELLNLKMKQDTQNYYQGASLKISSDSSGITDKFYQYAGSVRDSNGNLIYPKSTEEGAEIISPGIELRAEDFGLSCFDGCLISFAYRIGEGTKSNLMNDAVYAYPSDDDYNKLSESPTVLQYDSVMTDNVTQYRKSIVRVAEGVSATKIVFMTPVMGGISSDIFCLDNILIQTPWQDNGADLYVQNMDGYNSNAKPREIIEEIKINEKENTVKDESSKASDEKSGFSVMNIVVISLIGVAVVIVIIRIVAHRKKFY